MSLEESVARPWQLDEARVLAAIYFNSDFSIGDDNREECRVIADALHRSPGSVDRQWRNLHAVVTRNVGTHIGKTVKDAASEYLNNPLAARRIALDIVERYRWPLADLISGERILLRPIETPNLPPALLEALNGLAGRIRPKMFKTGSQGYFAQGKLEVPDGPRFQGQLSAIQIGSRETPDLRLAGSSEEAAFAIRELFPTLAAKSFRTGRTGFYTQSKVAIAAQRFQAAIQVVQIGDPNRPKGQP